MPHTKNYLLAPEILDLANLFVADAHMKKIYIQGEAKKCD